MPKITCTCRICGKEVPPQVKRCPYCGGPKRCNVEIIMTLSINNRLKLRVKDPNRKETLESKVRRSRKGRRAETRITRRPHGKALHIVWEEGDDGVTRLVHLDCKNCGNGWKIESGKPLEDFFEVYFGENNILIIRCKQCGQIYYSG